MPTGSSEGLMMRLPVETWRWDSDSAAVVALQVAQEVPDRLLRAHASDHRRLSYLPTTPMPGMIVSSISSSVVIIRAAAL